MVKPMVNDSSSVEAVRAEVQEMQDFKNEYVSQHTDKMDHYQVLMIDKEELKNMTPKEQKEEINRASQLLKMSFRDDPDPKHKTVMKAIDEASTTLCSETKRKEYDLKLDNPQPELSGVAAMKARFQKPQEVSLPVVNRVVNTAAVSRAR